VQRLLIESDFRRRAQLMPRSPVYQIWYLQTNVFCMLLRLRQISIPSILTKTNTCGYLPPVRLERRFSNLKKAISRAANNETIQWFGNAFFVDRFEASSMF
jgi:hypothetical protein